MSAPEPVIPGFVERIGLAITAPARAFAVADDSAVGRAPSRGGLSDVFLLLVLELVCLQLPRLVRSGWTMVVNGLSAGLADLGTAIQETAGTDLIALLVAGLVITIAAGERRSASRDFDLAGVAWIPTFTLEITVRLAAAILGLPLGRGITDVLGLMGLAMMLVMVGLAVRHARRRVPTPLGPVATPIYYRQARLAGRGILSILGGILLVNVVLLARDCDSVRPIGAGDLAPAFEVPRADGAGQVSLAGLTSAGKVVLIDFWATWCGPCEKTMPMLKRLHEAHHAAGFEIVSVNVDGAAAKDAALAYKESHALPFPVYLDTSGVANRYRVGGIPHLVVIDRRGQIRLVHVGGNGLGSLESRLDELIPELLGD